MIYPTRQYPSKVVDVLQEHDHVRVNGLYLIRRATFKANIYAISSDAHRLEFLKLHHFKLERI